MRQGRSSRCFLGFLLLVSIAVLSVSSIPLAQAEEAAEAVVDTTGEVDIQADEEPAAFDGPVVESEEPAAVDETTEEEVEEPVEVDEPVAVEEEAAPAEEEEEDAAAAVEEETTNIVSEVADSAKSKISEIVTQIKDISPQQKKKIAAGALGVWGVAAGAGWVLNNLGGSDE